MKASYLKRYPLSHLVIATVIILSLAPFSDMPKMPDISLLDKWVHFIMYGGLCSVIWWEYVRQHATLSWKRLTIGAIIAPMVMSGLLELMQEYCTATRSGEWLDLAANCIGVLWGALNGLILSRFYKG